MTNDWKNRQEESFTFKIQLILGPFSLMELEIGEIFLIDLETTLNVRSKDIEY